MEEIQPTPIKTIKPTKALKAKCWARDASVSEFRVLGWEDGSVRFQALDANGQPMNNAAVMGAAVAQDATDAAMEQAMLKAVNLK